jgi:glycosyltransferase involved in cell wall biosynthesis
VNFLFLGGYDPAYQRNAVIRKGLVAHGDAVAECPADPSFKVWLRYPLLLAKIAARAHAGTRTHARTDALPPTPRFPLRRAGAIYVPAFCQKDVPLARFLATLVARPVVFDPLASRYETKILDRRRRPADSLTARWNRWIDAMAFRLSDLVLADTAAHAAYYASAFGIPSRKFVIVPVGYDDVLFDPDRVAPSSAGVTASAPARPSAPAAGTAFTVLFFGSFLPLHGVDTVVKAARAVRRLDPAIRFRFVGSGDTWAHARALASDLGATNCAFEPWVPLAALPALVASADLALGIFGRTAKARRVVPHKIFQSLGMRKPVITARTPAVEEFFAHGEDLWLCGEPYSETLADAVIRLRSDAALRARLAAGGYRTVKERFTPAAVVSRLRGAVLNIDRSRRL